MPDVVVLVPMLRRAHLVSPLLASIHGSAPDLDVWFICTRGDDEVLEAVFKAEDHDLCSWLVLDGPVCDGDYARKINAGVHASTHPLIFTGAIDLHFHPGWLEACQRRLLPGIGVVGTNDLGNPRVIRGQHSTHSLVTREYAQLGTIDDPTKLLHEGYAHEYVDDELVGTARHRRAYAHADDAHVEHLHPGWNKAPTDDIYEAQGERMARSRRLFQRRKALWS